METLGRALGEKADRRKHGAEVSLPQNSCCKEYLALIFLLLIPISHYETNPDLLDLLLTSSEIKKIGLLYLRMKQSSAIRLKGRV